MLSPFTSPSPQEPCSAFLALSSLFNVLVFVLCVCSFFCLLSFLASSLLSLVSPCFCLLTSFLFLRSCVCCCFGSACVLCSTDKFPLRRDKSFLRNTQRPFPPGWDVRQTGIFILCGKKQWDNFRPESKLYYYRGHEPEKKKIPPQGTPMRDAMTSFR